MFRLSAIALLAASAALAAPVPKGMEAKLYFPTTVGAKRVSVMKQGDRTIERTETVTKVEEKDGMYRVTVEREKAPPPLSVVVYEVTDKGVTHMPASGDLIPVLRLGVKAGETWAAEEKLAVLGGNVPGPAPTSKHTYTMGREEEVVVPAGKFKAIKVEQQVKSTGLNRTTSVWYAPGVGVVKQETEVNGQKMVTELKSFTLGKDEKKDEPKKDK